MGAGYRRANFGSPTEILTEGTKAMSKSTVYLAGPILGCTHGEANTWREVVADKLKPHGIIGISPLRCEPMVGDVYQAGYNDDKFGTPRAIGSKNLFDTTTCTLVLAYLPLEAQSRRPSYGTIAEIAWAKAIGKPVIVVTDDPGVSGHPVLNFCASWLLPNLDDAVDLIIGLLAGYNGGKNV